MGSQSHKLRHRRGFLVIDGVVALGMAVTLLMAMTIMMIHGERAERKMAASRTGSRLVEESLLELQTGRTVAGLEVDRLTTEAPQGWVWVRVSMKENPARSLVGLVPMTAVKGSRP